MRKITRVRRSLLVTVLVLLIVTFSGSQVFAINPQPEPPGNNQVIVDDQILPLYTTPASNYPGLFGSLVSVPELLVNGLKQPLTSKNYDSAFIKRDNLIVKKLDPELLKSMQEIYFVPHQKDFSQYNTFTGNQDGWGGCIGRSMVHVMNIQNEMESPYTPDLSFWYMHRRQEQLANGGPVNTKYLLENYGLCAEASLPSDYDKATITNGVANFNTMPQPTAANDAEAAKYKVALLSEPVTPDVDAMKLLMVKYGPLLIEGPFPAVQGPNPQVGHCMTVVGWDDNYDGGGGFKILNSWGDYWDGDGFFWLKYSDLAANALDVRYIQDGPSDRTGTKYAYSARINLQGGAGALRNKLIVKIGVTGQEPWIFWNQPNRINCIDYSRNLCIDIPLPDYAAGNWPPSLQKHWYIEVTNGSNGSYTLQEFTLARQYKNAQGKLAVETFSYPSNGAVVESNTSKKFYIPTYTVPDNLPKVIKPVVPVK